MEEGSKHRLLPSIEEEEELQGLEAYTENEETTVKHRALSPFIIIALVLSTSLNIILLYRPTITQPHQPTSKYAGLSNNVSTEYHMYTEFMSINSTLADPLWDALPVSPILVALTETYTREHGLKDSIPFPWDDSRGLYHVKAFHHMHCLKNIRRAYLSALSPSAQPPSYTIPTRHILHCLDTLRQDLLCLADDTPMPTTPEKHHIGDGQVRQCRDFDALVRWTQAPERHACFRMLDEYRPVPHSLEQFDFCLEGSKEAEVARRYFAEWGHRDPFGDGEEGVDDAGGKGCVGEHAEMEHCKEKNGGY